VLNDLARLLSATEWLTFATGILNIWKHERADVRPGGATCHRSAGPGYAGAGRQPWADRRRGLQEAH